VIIGVFADAHDHIPRTKRAVEIFEALDTDLVVFAGDFVSPIVTPAFRKLQCPLLACYGDTEGNQLGISGGLRTKGEIAHAPFGFRTSEGLGVLVTHRLESCRGFLDEARIVIWAHTHKPSISRDREDRLMVNPGETCGWVFGRPTVALVETGDDSDDSEGVDCSARIIDLE